MAKWRRNVLEQVVTSLGLSVFILAGQVIIRVIKGKIHWRNTLKQLCANPVDYLVTPRVIASCIALPFFTLMLFTVGMVVLA
ncbi:hypothetical protein RND71_009008 [Anisodus tanguticus]|uniref:Uncharacterized protein n=1 Tax=Anisodus tanguticus TaxID=243964 RepID=A0AAE1SPR2_9SOLA|nr:hypothetical protein RND71_009008 [Anisodus tanguticus]